MVKVKYEEGEEEEPCEHCGGSEDNIQGCVGCCRDCGRPCEFEKDGEGFHRE